MRTVAVLKLPDREMPVVSMHSYLNTPQGWALYARCSAMGDMGPYREARADWERRHRFEMSEGREITAEDLRRWTAEDGEGLPKIEMRGRER